MARKSEIRTKRQALNFVASHLIGELKASSLGDLVGGEDIAKHMTNAEVSRLNWAIDDVSGRLQKLCSVGTADDE